MRSHATMFRSVPETLGTTTLVAIRLMLCEKSLPFEKTGNAIKELCGLFDPWKLSRSFKERQLGLRNTNMYSF